MDVILVPGLWLDASSWDSVIPALERAGHRASPLTLPGVGAPAAIAEGIGIAEWVAAVVAEIDAAQHPVALVGHSGGGNVVWGAADARPDKVARVIFVDTVPPAPGMGISEFDAVDGVVPFPGWRAFDEPDRGAGAIGAHPHHERRHRAQRSGALRHPRHGARRHNGCRSPP